MDETFVVENPGKVVASLTGDQDHVMRCRFDLLEPGRGMDGGGLGECQTSNGGVISVSF